MTDLAAALDAHALRVVKAVADHGSLTAAAASLGYSQPALSQLLKRLEAAGYITRQRNPEDERALAVRLTPAGQELRSQAEKVPGQVVERLGLPLAHLERVRDELTTLIAATQP